MDENRRTRPQTAGITALTVKGFKSIRDEQTIEIRPLTILAGANSSGKSSMIQPLLLLKQTLEAPYDPGPLLLEGPNVQFTSAEQAVTKGAIAWTVEIWLGASSLRLEFATRATSVGVISNSISVGEDRIRITAQMSREELIDVFSRFAEPSVRAAIQSSGAEWTVAADRCYLVPIVTPQGGTGLGWNLGRQQIDQPVRDIIHVPGIRGIASRFYPRAAVGAGFPGRFENYAASVIADWIDCGDPEIGRLGESLSELGLTSLVDAARIEATRIEVRVGRLLANSDLLDTVNIADVGFGVSQVLPVVVACLAAGPGRLVYIEEPEIHLHPPAQRRLASILADAAKRGVRIVAETHSSLLLLGVQTLVARGELDPKLVKMHWFERDPDSGFTTVHSTDLDDKGRFDTDWPVDFDRVGLQADTEYLDAAEARG